MAVTAASKKAFPPPVAQYEEEQTEAMNLSATPSTPAPLSSPTTPTHNPPIVLRIFKGTSQLVTPVEETASALPPAKKESSRRKSHHHHHHSDSHGHISPKRLRERNRDSHEEPIPKLRVINSTTEPVLQIVPEPTTQSVQPTVPKHEINDVKLEETTVQIKDSGETMEDITKQVEDLEKLKQAETLLLNTYTDFNVKTEKLLDVKPKVSESDREKLLAVLVGDECDDKKVDKIKLDVDIIEPKCEVTDENMTEVNKPNESADTEWFSDSDSDSIAEQINTLADSQQVKEDEQNKKPRTKKGSFFKSRSEVVEKKKYKWSLYKHKWEGGEQGSATPTRVEIEPQADSNHTTFEEDFEAEPLTRVTSYPEPDTDNEDAEAITSVKCTKKAKGVSN